MKQCATCRFWFLYGTLQKAQTGQSDYKICNHPKASQGHLVLKLPTDGCKKYEAITP